MFTWKVILVETLKDKDKKADKAESKPRDTSDPLDDFPTYMPGFWDGEGVIY
jgi:hypothetical protein